jgi:ERCC4-type nuclease
MIIIIDNREQQPWEFPGVETENGTLTTGDYSIKGYEDRFAIERKSIDDLARSLGTDRARFEAEIKRAQDMDNFAVVIEGTPAGVRAGNYYSNIHPNAIIGTTQKWPLKYGTLEFNWATDPENAAEEALRYLDRWYLAAASDLF